MNRLFNFLINLPKNALVGIIRLYQATISPDHGWFRARYPYGYCRHYPSCSEYAAGSILKHGAVKGVVFASRRVLACNPWAEPKIDPIK